VPLLLDVLVYVVNSTPLSGVIGQLKEGMQRQLEDVRRLLRERDRLCVVAALHFCPPGLGHPATVLYPLVHDSGGDKDEAALAGTRQEVGRGRGALATPRAELHRARV